jgi:hypothetical protein
VLLGGGGDDTTAAGGASPWRELGNSPTARQQVATAVVNGRIWVVGGLVGTETVTATRRVESYDPVSDTWRSEPPLPRPLHHAMAVAYGTELIVIGGWEPRGTNLLGVTSGEVQVLRGGRWVRLAPLSHPRAAAAAAVVGNRIVVTGGQGPGAKLVRQTEIFPGGRQWHDGADLPTPREHLAAASDGRFVYAVGGRRLESDRNTRALERYDVADDRWTKLPDMPVASGSLGATIIRGRLVAIGGESASRVLGNVQSYDLISRSWSALAGLPAPRHGLGVAAVGKTLYAIDGALGTGHVNSSDRVDALDLK